MVSVKLLRKIFKLESASLRLCNFLLPPVASYPLGLNIRSSTLFSSLLNLCSSLKVNDQISHPHKTTIKTTFVWILIFILSNRDIKQRISRHSLNLICSKRLREFDLLLLFSNTKTLQHSRTINYLFLIMLLFWLLVTRHEQHTPSFYTIYSKSKPAPNSGTVSLLVFYGDALLDSSPV
jgi:hypothetical protein